MMEHLLRSMASSCSRCIHRLLPGRYRAPPPAPPAAAAASSQPACESNSSVVPYRRFMYCRRPWPSMKLHMWRINASEAEKCNTDGLRTKMTQPPLMPSASASSHHGFLLPSWVRWVMGSLMAMIMPFWNDSWKKLSKIEDKVEMAVELAEEVAEAVEAAATAVEKVSSELAEKLPEGGKLQMAAKVVESVAEEAADKARMATDIIHKVEELKEEVESLVEPRKHGGGSQQHLRAGN